MSQAGRDPGPLTVLERDQAVPGQRRRSSPSTTKSTGPATSTSRAAALSWSAAWAAWRAVTGTGRCLRVPRPGAQGCGAGEREQGGATVPAGHQYGGHVAASCPRASPCSSYSTSPSSATTGTSTRASWSSGERLVVRVGSSASARARTPPARPPRPGSALPSSPAKPGIGDGCASRRSFADQVRLRRP